ncbi:MAG TPA: SirB2 family protein [Aliidiomarina sp.]|nr:SirB2 family protein [Aliidiomarina sp.]
MYMMFKHLHGTLVVLSLVFLLARVFLAWNKAEKLDKKWLKVLPHVIDGLLVASIIGLLVLSAQYSLSLSSPFFVKKMLGFVVYITFSVLTVLALRGRFSAKLKAPFAALAIVSWFWLVKVAVLKQGIMLASVS